MKKLILLFLISILTRPGFSYTWESFGPEGIKATNLYFFVDYEIAPLIIFSDSGMFVVSNGAIKSWEFFNYPAKDATELNNTTVLFVAGNGSYSDGIYSLHIPSFQIDVVEYCLNPSFIKYYDQTGDYYVGHENGLLKSENGLSWEAVPYFDGKNCVGLDFYYTHLVANVLADLTHLYLSDDEGSSWEEASYCPGWISSLAFREDGELFGVFPDNSYSSGLWSSDDYGNNWEVEFYSVDMNTVSTAEGESFAMVGWTNSVNEYEGIALYDPDVPPPGLTFLNETLPNKNINSIDYRLQICMGAVLYVCTDNGVYSCWDYFVGIDEQANQNTLVNIYPNPVKDKTIFKISLQELYYTDISLEILNNQGLKVDEIKVGNNTSKEINVNWNKNDLPAGVYYLVIRTEKEQLSEKFIVL